MSNASNFFGLKLSLNIKSLLILVVFTVACAIQTIVAPIAQAQSTENGIRLSLSPLPINLATTPGKTITTELRVRNSGSQTETLQAGLLKFSADETTGDPILLDREDGDDYFDWVQFSPSQLTLVPNEWGEIQMTITVPDSAAFGYYYAVTFGRVNEAEPQAGQATLQGAAATLVLLEVDVPGAKRDLEVEYFKTVKGWYEFLPVEFEARLRNRGNVHAVPFGNIFIKQGDTTIETLDFNDARGSILPNSPRTFNADWSRGFPVYEVETNNDQVVLDEQGNPKQSLKWDFANASQLRFGKYTAEMVIAYDDGERDVPLTASVEFWVIPWRIILAVVVILAVFVFGLAMMVRGAWKGVRRDDDDYV